MNEQTRDRIRLHWFRKYAVVFAVVLLAAVLQFSHERVQQDDYYHITSSVLIRQTGFYRQLPWAAKTVLTERFADMHFLYHVLLIPFAYENSLVPAKISAVLLAGLLAGFTLWFLRKRGIAYASFWTLLLMFGSSSFMIRSLAVRPITLSIIFYMAAVWFLLERRYVWLAPLSWLFVLTYPGFPVILAVVVVYVIVGIMNPGEKAGPDPRPLLLSLLGTGAGLVVNPYFPNNLRILYIQILQRSFSDIGAGINLEWLPLTSWALFLSTWGVFIFLLAVLFLVLGARRKFSFQTQLLFALTLLFLFTFSRFARGVDQFVPFGVLFAASAFNDLRMDTGKILKWTATAVLAVVLCVNLYSAMRGLRSVDALDNRGSARWLEENSPVGSTVFLFNYGAFPQLFYYNRHNVYTGGLDPIFVKALDPGLFDSLQDALALRTDPYPVIRDRFGASYLHIENLPANRVFYLYCMERPDRFGRVYQDGFSAVFIVR